MQNFRRQAVSEVSTFTTGGQCADFGADERKKRTLPKFSQDLLQLFQETTPKQGLSDRRTETDVYLVFVCKTAADMNVQLAQEDAKVIPEPALASAAAPSTESMLHYQRKLKQSARIPIETDSVPSLVVTGIAGVDCRTDHEFCLPCFVLDDDAWRSTFGSFDDWLFSACRYPKMTEDRTTPSYHESSFRSVSSLDVFELYASAVVGTLAFAYQCRDVKKRDYYLDMAWKATHVLKLVGRRLAEKHKLSIYEESKNEAGLAEELRKRIERRDQDKTSAVAYKKFVNELSPTSVYRALYELSAYSAESVHRSNMVSFDLFLAGLLTHNQSVRYEGIATHILRMALERCSKHIGAISTSHFIDKDALVKELTTVVGKTVQTTLRRCCFLAHAVNAATSELALPDWIAHLGALKSTVLSLKGLLPLCFFLDESVSRYLNEDHASEWVLGCAQNRQRKFSVMDSTMLVSHGVSSFARMHAVLQANIERKAKAMMVLETELKDLAVSAPSTSELPSTSPATITSTTPSTSSAVVAASSDTSTATTQAESDARSGETAEVSTTLASTAESKDEHETKRYAPSDEEAEEAWKQFLGRASNSAESYKRYIANMARQDKNVKHLKALLVGVANKGPQLLCTRRAVTIIVRACNSGSEMDRAFVRVHTVNDSLRRILPKNRALADLAFGACGETQLTEAKEKIKKKEVEAEKEAEEEKIEKSAPILFVSFKEAQEILKKVAPALTLRRETCAICYEKRSDFVVLHGDERHQICKTCASHESVTRCPFCRADIAG